MDTLSRLIDLARPQASLDLRCLFSGPFDVDHAPMEAGIAPFHLVLDGACVVEMPDGTHTPLAAGDFMLFPRGARHRLRDAKRAGQGAPIMRGHDGMLPVRRNDHAATAAAADVDILCGRFVYSPGSSALLLQALPDPLHVSLAAAHPPGALQTLIALMRSEAERREAGALAIVTGLSHALFAMALRVHGERDPAGAGLLGLLADARLGASVQRMLDEPARAWTIAELGEAAAMSRATYARRFNECAGITVMDFLTQLRMGLAADLLRRTRRGVAEIGESVGYQSEAAFGKAFAQHAGVTPGRYRRQHGAQPSGGVDNANSADLADDASGASIVD